MFVCARYFPGAKQITSDVILTNKYLTIYNRIEAWLSAYEFNYHLSTPRCYKPTRPGLTSVCTNNAVVMWFTPSQELPGPRGPRGPREKCESVPRLSYIVSLTITCSRNELSRGIITTKTQYTYTLSKCTRAKAHSFTARPVAVVLLNPTYSPGLPGKVQSQNISLVERLI